MGISLNYKKCPGIMHKHLDSRERIFRKKWAKILR